MIERYQSIAALEPTRPGRSARGRGPPYAVASRLELLQAEQDLLELRLEAERLELINELLDQVTREIEHARDSSRASVRDGKVATPWHRRIG